MALSSLEPQTESGDAARTGVAQRGGAHAHATRQKSLESERQNAPTSPWTWELPGQGEPCGRPEHRPFRYMLCGAGEHIVPYVDCCDRRDCPTCWREGWLRREAEHVLAVLRAEQDSRRKVGGSRTKPVHVSLNPPPKLWDAAKRLRTRGRGKTRKPGFRWLRASAYRVARTAGIEGGSAVFHRVRCADKADPIETDGPHFHVLGFGWVSSSSSWAKHGWVVKNHGLRDTDRQVLGTAEYVLSHSHRAEGISPEGKSAGLTLSVTWTGRLLGAGEVPENGRWCPLCRDYTPPGMWIRVDWIGQGPPPEEPVNANWALWALHPGWGQE